MRQCRTRNKYKLKPTPVSWVLTTTLGWIESQLCYLTYHYEQWLLKIICSAINVFYYNSTRLLWFFSSFRVLGSAVVLSDPSRYWQSKFYFLSSLLRSHDSDVPCWYRKLWFPSQSECKTHYVKAVDVSETKTIPQTVSIDRVHDLLVQTARMLNVLLLLLPIAWILPQELEG